MKYIEGSILRSKARREYQCTGDGALPSHHAKNCTPKIKPGEPYLEYVGETFPFQSGTRHCMACANAFYVEKVTAK